MPTYPPRTKHQTTERSNICLPDLPTATQTDNPCFNPLRACRDVTMRVRGVLFGNRATARARAAADGSTVPEPAREVYVRGRPTTSRSGGRTERYGLGGR